MIKESVIFVTIYYFQQAMMTRLFYIELEQKQASD